MPMSRKEKKMLKRQQKLQKKHEKMMDASKFTLWRNSRPFWGATLTLLAGLMILYIPIHLFALAFTPGSYAILGILFGGLIVLIGILAYFYPNLSTMFGIVTIFLSVLSIMGALGGFLVGTILGIFGGAILVGWNTESVTISTDKTNQKKKKKIEGDQSSTPASL